MEENDDKNKPPAQQAPAQQPPAQQPPAQQPPAQQPPAQQPPAQQPPAQQSPAQQPPAQQPPAQQPPAQHTIKSLVSVLKEKELRMAGMEAGLNCPDDLMMFRDRFEFDDKINVKNKDAVIEQLKTEKPYLFKTQGGGVPPTDNNPARVDGGKSVFTLDQVSKMSDEDFKKHKNEIIKQMTKGWIK